MVYSKETAAAKHGGIGKKSRVVGAKVRIIFEMCKEEGTFFVAKDKE